MNVNFEKIAGYEVEKQELKRLCDIFNNRVKFQNKGAKLPKGIIFYGESGTGKTLFAKVMASECDLEVLKINISEIEKESDICKLIKKTFAKANRKKEPTMIFLFLPLRRQKQTAQDIFLKQVRAAQFPHLLQLHSALPQIEYHVLQVFSTERQTISSQICSRTEKAMIQHFPKHRQRAMLKRIQQQTLRDLTLAERSVFSAL